MHIPGTDFELRVVLAKPVNINIGHDVNGRAGPRVPEDPLQIGLDCQVWAFAAVENSDPRVSGQGPIAVLGYSLVSSHCSLNERGKDRDDEWSVGVFLVGVGE